MNGNPLILAHRGLVTEYQENTLAALQGALDSPYCNGSEFDVFLTKDHRVVLFHDENMKRLTGVDKQIYDMTWEDLKTIQILPEIEIDGGMRKYDSPANISLLEDALETIKGKDFFADIELKAYQLSWSKRKIGRAVAKIINAMEMQDQVICTSFNFFMLRDLENVFRSTPTGFAYDDNMPGTVKILNWFMESNFVGKMVHSNAICTEYTLVDKNTIKKYHDRNMRVGSFTLYPLMSGEMPEDKRFHYSEEVKRLANLGIDWIETDQPELAWKDLYE